MIAAVGVRTVVENQVDFNAPRNLLIAAVILVLGLGGATITFGNISIYGMALAAIVGIILNKLLPGAQKYTSGGAGTDEEDAKKASA